MGMGVHDDGTDDVRIVRQSDDNDSRNINTTGMHSYLLVCDFYYNIRIINMHVRCARLNILVLKVAGTKPIGF